MAKDIDTNNDISPDTKVDVNNGIGSDFGGDLASDTGTDLNANDGQQDIPAKSEANNLSMSKDTSWGERLGACVSALGAIASPINSQYAQMENLNGHDIPVDYAIYQEYNNPNQQIDAELAQFAELQEMENRERNREASESNSASNEPISADHCDPPQAEPADQESDMSLDDLNSKDK